MRRFVVGLLATVGALTLIAIGGAATFLYSGPFAAKPLPPSMILSLDLRDVPPETTSTDVLRGDLWRGSRDIAETVQLLWQAADDPRIVGLFVDIGDETAGLARVQELRQAIAHFRGKGKFAVGFAESLGGGGDHFADYYLATALDQIWLQPSGGFAVAGLAVETPFLKGGLDKLGVHMEGGKRYEYKSAPDTFNEAGMAAPARENLQQLVDGLYTQFVEDAARDRRLAPPKLRQLIDQAPFDSERAHQEGLIDRVGYRADALNEVLQRAGSTQDIVSFNDYASDKARVKTKGEIVALVRASGTISSSTGGSSPLDDDATMTSDDVIDALDAAAQNKDVRAIVLRIDSPGGTYPAADALADGVARARASGKPVIVSMGDVAASGGYLAAVRADVIVAEPSTITGSIGVFGMWPVGSELLTMLGVKVERVAVGANAGMYSTYRSPTQSQRAAIGRELDVVYADFARQVAEARKLDAARLDEAARGRVFTGTDAKRVGLVDELGGLQLALSIARAKAGIDETRPIEVRRFPIDGDRWQRLLDRALKLAGIDAKGPQIRAPKEVREALARIGVYSRPGTVRLPPLPPLWR